MGDASEENIPSAISSVDAEEEWVSASWSLVQGRSLHPHDSKSVPLVETYVACCDALSGLKRRCWSAKVELEE